jgi:hypothetical protein
MEWLNRVLTNSLFGIACAAGAAIPLCERAGFTDWRGQMVPLAIVLAYYCLARGREHSN